MKFTFLSLLLLGGLSSATPEISSIAWLGKTANIKLSEPAAQSGSNVSGFSIMDTRRGEAQPVTASIKGDHVIIKLQSHASLANIAQFAAISYSGNNLLAADTQEPFAPYQSRKSINKRAIPLGEFPVVGKYKIACIGDSITAGAGIANPKNRYPYLLGEKLGERFEVRNFGNSGRTAGDYPSQRARKRWWGAVPQYQAAIDFDADLYICNLGINDTGAWWDPKLFESGYSHIIEGMRSNRNANFLAWGKLGPDFRGPIGEKTYPGNISSKYTFNKKDNGSAKNRPAVEKIIKKLSRQQKFALIDAYTPVKNHVESYKKDGLHPTEEGCDQIADFSYDWVMKKYSKKKQ